MLDTISAADLQRKTFPKQTFLVEGILPRGLSVLAGAPKTGKSYMVQQLAIAVAEGGTFLGAPVEQGDVLYLALEDSHPRLKRRLGEQLGHHPFPARLHLTVAAPLLGNGLLDELEEALARMECPRLIVIDTYSFVKGSSGGGKESYDEAVARLRPLKDLMLRYNISILLVHHTRKRDGSGRIGDAFEEILGSQGLFATTDTGMVLRSERQGGPSELHLTGRDVESQTIDVKFDTETHTWRPTDRPLIERLGITHREADVLQVVKEGATTPKEIIEELGLSGPQVSGHLATLVEGGHVIRISHGVYNYVQPTAGRQPEVNSATPPEVSESDEPVVTDNENPGVKTDDEFDFLTF